MTREEYLKFLILSKYKSIRSFSDNIGVANSTIVSMLDKGVGGTGIDTVIKVCKALGITADEIASYDEKKTVSETTETVSDTKLLSIYKSLSDEDKKQIDDYIRYIQSRKKEQ